MDPLDGTNGCSNGANGDEVSGANGGPNGCVPLATMATIAIGSIRMDPIWKLHWRQWIGSIVRLELLRVRLELLRVA